MTLSASRQSPEHRTKYEYDRLGQLKSAKRYWPDWAPVAGQQFEYAFDDIGNRTSTKAGGDENGLNLRSAAYGANSLNQYTNRTVPGAFDILGLAFATSSVTVNSQTAYREGEYFRKELMVNNTNSALWTNVTVAATGQTSQNGNQFLPQTPENFGYDLDGNLISDGQWSYGWDAENRLVAMAANTTVGPQISLKFEYDCQGRRVRKQVWSNKTWSGNSTNDVRFAYDGWNLIGILNSSFSLQTSFTWGLDLSGSLQGAGGVGGLLAVSQISNSQITNSAFAAFDGNGNVAALVNAADGSVAARFEYGPFGEVLRATGPMAKANPFRFSTKYQDEETDLLYYGYRYYSASAGRWNSRDPAEDGLNLYSFAENRPVQRIDIAGLGAVDRVRQKLTEAVVQTGVSEMVRTTRVPDALSRFMRLLPRVKAVYGATSKGTGAFWSFDSHEMIIDRAVPTGAYTIVHEMTHAVQDLELGYPGGFDTAERDEGQAYAMQAMYAIALRVRSDQHKFEQAGCNPGAVMGIWQNFWRTYGTLPNVANWGEVVWDKEWIWQHPGRRPLDQTDLRGIYDIFAVKLGCSALADVVNSILAGYHCCVSVKCSGDDTSAEISPGIKIDPIFN